MKRISKVFKGLGLFLGWLVLAIGSQALAQGDTWETKTPMPTARWGPAAGVIDGQLYVVGGQEFQQSSLLEVYDPATDSWSTKTSMSTPRFAPAAGVINGKLYVVGGGGELNVPLATLEIYNPATDTWDTTKAPMPTARWRAMGGVIDDKLYVVGGDPGPGGCGQVTNVLEVYDPVTDTWDTTKASMPTARFGAAVAVLDGKLHVAGGELSTCAPLTSVHEVYDPTTDTWSTKTSMPAPRDELTNSTGVINGLWYVVGGRLDPFTGLETDIMEIYDPGTDTWVAGLSMPTAREQAAAGVINDQLYVAGGRGLGGFLLDTLEVYTPPITEITVALDIKPQSCPNPLNIKSKGVLPVAILGTEDFDVTEIDLASIRLAGVAPIRSSIEDVSTPLLEKQDECDCISEGVDGIDDLTLKFDTQEIVSALGEVADGDELVLTLTGALSDGTPIEGEDCIIILSKGKGKEK